MNLTEQQIDALASKLWLEINGAIGNHNNKLEEQRLKRFALTKEGKLINKLKKLAKDNDLKSNLISSFGYIELVSKVLGPIDKIEGVNTTQIKNSIIIASIYHQDVFSILDEVKKEYLKSITK